jgi:glycosyltransferase involved in cell wall biosynthesis
LVLGLRRLLGEQPVDVVHANGWIAYASAAAVAGGDTPLVISVRDYGYACATRSLLWRDRELCHGPAPGRCLDCAAHRYGPLKALAAVGGVRTGRSLLRRTVRGIHSVSRFVEHTVQRDLLRNDPTWRPALARIPDVVPPAASGPQSPSARDQALLASLPSVPFILFVGALQGHKGLGVLLEAWTRLAVRDSACPPLVLIGTRWPDTPVSFPSDVTVLTDVPHPVVMTAWERSLFGVAPSVWPDPLPGVVREAMSRRRAVVATAVGGNPDMITDGENGLLVRPGDADDLANAMARLLGDPDLRERLGQAGWRSVQDLTADRVAAQFETLYQRSRSVTLSDDAAA